ncbi:MAG: hypothetical protein K2G13_05175, partial [Muribaculaceae bacterium]|nr:hypothetical protein [Muribaculaceae bacterium]
MKLMRPAVLAVMSVMALTNYMAKADNSEPKAEDHLVSLDVEARLDWQLVTHKGLDRAETGFIGKYIALK